jgi:hypothetical protein
MKTLLFNKWAGNFLAFFVGCLFLCVSTYANGSTGLWEGPTPIIIGLTLSCTWVIRLHAYREAIRIRRSEEINHLERFIFRTVIAFIISYFIHGALRSGTLGWSIELIACMFYIGSLFWLLFDFMLNYDRHKELFYVSKWYKTSALDRVFHRDPRWWLVSKLVLYFLALWLYVESF